MEKYNEKMFFLASKNKYYEISFVVSNDKNKIGREELHNYKEYIDPKTFIEESLAEPYKRENSIAPKDLFGEKREKVGVIGTTIVNILNSSASIINILKCYKNRLKEINKQTIEKFYNLIFDLSNKNNIYKIDIKTRMSEFYNISDLINDTFLEVSTDLSMSEIIEKIENQNLLDTTRYETKIIYYFIREVYKIQNIEILESGTNDIIRDCIENYNKNKIKTIQYIYEYTAIRTLELIKAKIANVLKEYHFVITNFIEQFTYDLNNIYTKYSNEDIIYHLSELESLNKTNDYTIPTYNREILLYYKENYNQETYLQDLISIFIDYLVVELNSILRICTPITEWKKYKNSIKNMYYDKYGITLDSFEEMEKAVHLNLSKNKLKEITKQKIVSLFNSILKSCELPRVRIYDTEIKYNNENLPAKEFVYKISSLQDLLYTTLYHLEMDNRQILQCNTCNRYFVSYTRNNEIFCKRIDPYDSKQRLCSAVGNANIKENLSKEVKDLKHKIENRLWNKKKYGEELKEYYAFKKAYKEYKQKIKQKEHSKNKIAYYLYKWLKEYDKKLQNKYKSDRYGIWGTKKNKEK